MKWKKLGLIFDPKVFSWADHTALQPTPLLMDDRIRIFLGARDQEGVSRVGFVDLDKQEPTKILGFSKEPILDIGEPGCFDESGVVPSAIVEADGLIYMYFAGYQLGTKVRFSVLGGLAISKDYGLSFERCKKTPVFERNDDETLFRVPHSVIKDGNTWRAWYGGGSQFTQGKHKTLPIYNVRYVESKTPFSFPNAGEILLETEGDEYRIGRPFIFEKSPFESYLFYGFSTENAPYKLGCAKSSDMKSWNRIDDELGLPLSDSGWDSEMMAYPSVLKVNEKTYLFYNGNEYGKQGFGLAELIEW
ncbi:hypothetical protein QN366_02450 [Pseudomonas sp. CCC3.2]|uniref:hypothetical protein n=1 Tax=unclassified Pseudomonas TaxID=196821 RepID=UPI002AB40C43|nr:MULTISPECIES: hypothetical protein [unclassified Pseudomonas]MDY7561402.1 hypothetical protein [Pseudomonas sp. AB6]MEB0178934.1 hypothetical protein [Pseudomonas sp. CCC3.2]MEB0210198.1 hypothetical protein [Pseudomonas sp. AB6]